MSYKEMNLVEYNTNRKQVKDSYYSKITTGDWILIPEGVEIISVVLDSTSASAKIQICNDVEAILSGSTEKGVCDWDNGVVADAISSSVVNIVFAIRMSIISGNPVMLIYAS